MQRALVREEGRGRSKIFPIEVSLSEKLTDRQKLLEGGPQRTGKVPLEEGQVGQETQEDAEHPSPWSCSTL